MVDSRQGEAMANELEARVERVEKKVDALTASIDARFDQVDVAIAEQQQYTTFAFFQLEARLIARMDNGFARMEGRFQQIDGKLDQIDRQFQQVDGRFAQIDGRFSRIERKLDQFIDTQSRANALMERRLRRLEPPTPDGE